MKTITAGIRQQIEDRNTTLVWWGMNHVNYETLLNELQEAGFDAALSVTGLEVTGTGDKTKLVAAFRIFRRHGFEPTTRPGAKETYFSTNFYKEDLKSIWFTFSSDVCKRVKIGTKMEEVAVYEVQCGQSMAITDEDLS